jgi:hypothetical protein
VVANKQTEPTSLGKSEKLQYYFCAQFPLKFEESAAASVESTAE